MIDPSIAFIAIVSVITTPPIYHIDDLGTLGGELANGLAINEPGDVCGQAENENLGTQAFVWREAEGIVNLGSFIGPHGYGRADGINDLGYVVGGAMEFVDPGYSPQPFIWHEPIGMLDLGIPPFGMARDINNSNQVCGVTGNAGAFVWDAANGAVYFDLGNPDGWGADANAINNQGIVAGMGWDANFDYMAYTYDMATGQITILPGFDDSNTARDINDGNVVVGSSALPNNQRLPAYWTPGGQLVEIPLLAEPDWIVHGEAEGVNDAGWIVGSDWAAEPGHLAVGWLFIDGEKWALDDLIVEVGGDIWEIVWAKGINNAGQIAGIAIKNGVPGVAFRMTPVACPADIDGNGAVDVDDLTAVILDWGMCPGDQEPCPADIVVNGSVDVDDLTAVILGWGACPQDSP